MEINEATWQLAHKTYICIFLKYRRPGGTVLDSKCGESQTDKVLRAVVT